MSSVKSEVRGSVRAHLVEGVRDAEPPASKNVIY